MPASIEDYFRDLLDIIASGTFIRSSEIIFDKRSSTVGFVRGAVYFTDESTLHIRELIDLRKSPVRVMYVYHYQNDAGKFVFRYDNTPHHPELTSFPHHKHTPAGVNAMAGEPPELEELFSEIESQVG